MSDTKMKGGAEFRQSVNRLHRRKKEAQNLIRLIEKGEPVVITSHHPDQTVEDIVLNPPGSQALIPVLLQILNEILNMMDMLGVKDK